LEDLTEQGTHIVVGGRSLVAGQPQAVDCWPVTSDCSLAATQAPFVIQLSPIFLPPTPIFFPPTSIFFLMWSTPHWLKHMSALPKLLLKTSDTHNFWSVAPKIMKFVLTRSLLQDAFGKQILKILKIVW
jgi:hypothetical protein